MTDSVGLSGGPPVPASEPTAGEKPHQFGLPAAMALIVGTIIGVGIFNLWASRSTSCSVAT
jgi:basic amino acid/polyamine antiporter, APA family